jgi:hypothetical protein
MLAGRGDRRCLVGFRLLAHHAQPAAAGAALLREPFRNAPFRSCRAGRRATTCGVDRRLRTLLVAAVLGCGFVIGPASTTPTDGHSRVALGGRTSFAAGYSAGWGTAEPSFIDNGGDPSGRVTKIRWQNWGLSRATGDGLIAVPSIKVKSYVLMRAELRASRIGHCTPGGPRAYTLLQIRTAPRPSGKFSKWELWNLRTNLCHG